MSSPCPGFLLKPLTFNPPTLCAQTGPLGTREDLPSAGVGAVVRPAHGHQAGGGDPRVPGGLHPGPLHLDPPAGGGLPQRRRASPGGHHRYRHPPAPSNSPELRTQIQWPLLSERSSILKQIENSCRTALQCFPCRSRCGQEM